MADEELEHGPLKACAVCGRILDYYHDRDAHDHNLGAILGGEVDHPAVVVDATELPEQLIPRCDFCYAEFPAWMVPARSFRYPGLVGLMGHNSEGDWAACDRCVEFIQTDRWQALLVHIQDAYKKRGDELPEMVISSLQALHQRVRSNITGAPRRVRG